VPIIVLSALIVLIARGFELSALQRDAQLARSAVNLVHSGSGMHDMA
jgi:hypothetical protein